MARRARRVLVLLLPNVHVLDLAGPVQVLHEADHLGGAYDLTYCGPAPHARTAQGLLISGLRPLPEVAEGDLILVPGIDSSTLGDLGHVPAGWLRGAYEAGATLCSICSGAFVLARAGLLDGLPCTTHWKVADRLQKEYPAARVVMNRLFVRAGRIVTSAGVASGIDMALSLVEEDHGPMVTARVAREIVVYVRRDGSRDQSSVYLEYRTHMHPGIHRVQDWMISHPESRPTIQELSRLAGISPRHLTRTFRQATGITLKAFASRLKLEVAGNLLHDPALTIENVATQCGFKDARQLRRLWKRRYGASPSTWKEEEKVRTAQ